MEHQHQHPYQHQPQQHASISNTVTFRSPDQKMHEIVPSLFLGSMFAAQDKDLLLAHNITHILQVAEELSPRFPSTFVYKVIDACDMEEYPIDQHFEECIDYVHHVINVKKQNILVHCLGGISRSTSIVIAYLMREHNLSYEEALQTVTRKRVFANPNKGFKKLLQQYGGRQRDLFAYTYTTNTNTTTTNINIIASLTSSISNINNSSINNTTSNTSVAAATSN